MDIEERLLGFSPQAPLHAWRLFRVRADGQRLVLASPMYRDDTTGRTPLWPAAEANASCHKGHLAPTPGCRCGIYGAVDGTLDSLPGYLRDTACDRDPWAYAEIACYGRVFADMRGVRAERATLVRIALPATGWPGEAAPREASRMLRDRYGVPVGGAECAPQWLTANVRPGGPSADGESLSLNLSRLDLSRQGDPGDLERRAISSRRTGSVNLTRTSRDAPGTAPSGLTPSIASTTSYCRTTIDNLALSHERVERPGADRARAAAVR